MTMTPDDQAFLAKKKDMKAERRARPSIEEGKLGMTSLMDIVSIIVVYLLKSYNSDPVIINPTAGQKIPMSMSDGVLQDGIPVYVTGRGIIFGEQKIVNMTQDGDVDPASLDNHLITPLYDAMAEEVDKAKTMAENRQVEGGWAGRLILVGDQNLKFSTLVDVLYTAGRAEFSQYAFCVIRKNS